MKINKKYWLVYLIGAILSLTAGVILLPIVTDLGTKILSFVLAVVLVIYLACFISFNQSTFKGKMTSKKTMNLLEIVFLLVIIILFVLKGIGVVSFNLSSGALIGLVILAHGLFHLVLRKEVNAQKLYIYYLNIILVILGTYLTAVPVIGDKTIIWGVSILLLALGIVLIILTTLSWPKKKSV